MKDLVWLVLRQLNQIHLLAESVGLRPKPAGISRRDMVRTLGTAAVVAVPPVMSIVSPTAVQAATCTLFHQDCCSNNRSSGP